MFFASKCIDIKQYHNKNDKTNVSIYSHFQCYNKHKIMKMFMKICKDFFRYAFFVI